MSDTPRANKIQFSLFEYEPPGEEILHEERADAARRVCNLLKRVRRSLSTPAELEQALYISTTIKTIKIYAGLTPTQRTALVENVLKKFAEPLSLEEIAEDTRLDKRLVKDILTELIKAGKTTMLARYTAAKDSPTGYYFKWKQSEK